MNAQVDSALSVLFFRLRQRRKAARDPDWILPPMSRQIAGDVLNADARFGMLRAVVGFEGKDRRRGPLAQSDAIDLGLLIFDRVEVFGQACIEAVHLRGKERGQRIMRSLADS